MARAIKEIIKWSDFTWRNSEIFGGSKNGTNIIGSNKTTQQRIGHYFFERGDPPVLSKRGNYLLTRGYGNGKFVVYKYYPKSGRISFIDHFDNQTQAKAYMKRHTS